MFRIRIASAILLSIVASTASAQTQGTEKRPPSPVLPRTPRTQFFYKPIWMLIEYPAVQKELKLTPAEKERLKKRLEEVERHHQDELAKLNEARKELGPNPDPETSAEFRKQSAAVQSDGIRERDAMLLAVLDRPRRTRMEQIQLQALGALAFRMPNIQEKLNLSPDQIEAMMEITTGGIREEKERTDATTIAVAKSFVRDPEAPNRRIMLPKQEGVIKAEYEKLAKDLAMLRKSVDQSIYKTLSKKQRTTYEKMLGEPFDPEKLTSDPIPMATPKKAETKSP